AGGLFVALDESVVKAVTNHAAPGIGGFAVQMLVPFGDVWADPLGPFAIGLTAIQAVFGAILFWDLGQREGVRATLRWLYNGRPIPTVCFLLLTVAVGTLAGYRAYELSPTS